MNLNAWIFGYHVSLKPPCLASLSNPVSIILGGHYITNRSIIYDLHLLNGSISSHDQVTSLSRYTLQPRLGREKTNLLQKYIWHSAVWYIKKEPNQVEKSGGDVCPITKWVVPPCGRQSGNALWWLNPLGMKLWCYVQSIGVWLVVNTLQVTYNTSVIFGFSSFSSSQGNKLHKVCVFWLLLLDIERTISGRRK